MHVRMIIAALVVVVTTAITWSWVWTVPKCLSSGWGTPGYWATSRSLAEDDGVLGCWPKQFTKERVREEAFKEWALESVRLERERHPRQGRW